MTERQRISSGSPYEPTIGFSRAVRVGDHVWVSGTAPIWPDGSCDPDAADGDAIAAVHAEFFGAAPPVSTMVVVSGFLDLRWKVEIEAEAVIA